MPTVTFLNQTGLSICSHKFKWGLLICAIACLHTCIFAHMHSQQARVFSVTLSTPCHLSFPYSLPSIWSFPPSLLDALSRESGLESKVQVCRLADESQRFSNSPPPPVPHPTLSTVCKYAVSLIERSTSSQQLSFLLSCVCLCSTAALEPEGGQWWSAV